MFHRVRGYTLVIQLPNASCRCVLFGLHGIFSLTLNHEPTSGLVASSERLMSSQHWIHNPTWQQLAGVAGAAVCGGVSCNPAGLVA